MSTAKSPEPAQPKIMLRVGGQKPSPALASSTLAGVTDHDEVLEPQRDPAKAGTNGRATVHDIGPRQDSRNSLGDTGSTPVPTSGQASQDKNPGATAMSPSISVNGVKTEAQLGRSPALGSVQLRRSSHGSSEALQSPNLAASSMPPPSSVTPRLASGSPHPQAQNHTNHVAQPAPTNVFDSKWRQPGKGRVFICILLHIWLSDLRCL